jgi:hypothetical protein
MNKFCLTLLFFAVTLPILGQTNKEIKITCQTLASLTDRASLEQRGNDVILYERTAASIRANHGGDCESQYFQRVVTEIGPSLGTRGEFLSLGAFTPTKGWTYTDMKQFVNLTTGRRPEQVLRDLDGTFQPIPGWSKDDLSILIGKLRAQGKLPDQIIRTLDAASETEHLRSEVDRLQREVEALRSQRNFPH